MKQRLISILFGAAHLTVYSQYFSGEVHYRMEIVAKSGINADSLLALRPGTSSVYLITDRYYKTTYYKDGKQTYSYTYHDETKRMYDEVAGKSYITFRDSRKGNTTFVGSAQYKDSIEVILDHRCFMVKKAYDNYTAKTFYATDLRINPESFKGHEVGDWYRRMKEVNGALNMKTITEFPTHFEIQEAVKLIERPVKRDEFNLPDKNVVASFSALDKQVTLKTPSRASLECYHKKLNAVKRKVQFESFTSYVAILVSETGVISQIEPYNEDEFGFFEISLDIIKNCGLEFIPGQIDGKPVSSLVYFPVEFRK